ncbi:hypothetical protein DFH08DRAFT_944040 [Mycena albidolilacea]|uniref:Uncharacterized protein n=1 Tax=Mycena albidolilacea TaxID=1033008 RepID=A0AAD6Z7A9_9AGAR|nr:hypothetical protein DFH08DRAFT_944040 [Mycena albidolilacea]
MLTVRDAGPGLDGQTIYSLKIIFLKLAVAAIFYGLFLCIGIMSSYTLIRKGLRGQRARQALLASTVTMLLASTAHLALYMAYIIVQFPTLAVEYVDPAELMRRLDISQTLLRRLTYFLSDVIVVWRAWVIWQENRIVHAALAVCILGTGVTSLTLAVFNIKSEFDGTQYTRDAKNFLGTFGLLVTNFLATALITYKLWYYRRNVKKYMNRSGGGNTQVENVLILLMETGGFYCAFWILLMVGDYGYYGPDFDFEWFQPYISGIYPTIIIFMVSRQMMLSEEVLGNPSLPISNNSERTIWFASASVTGRSEPQISNDSSVMLDSLAQK